MTISSTNLKQKGFTIVELLIVIVVIAILAAITVIAYNGVQNKAKTVAGQSAADTVKKKIEIYRIENEDSTPYPGALTNADPSETYYLSGVDLLYNVDGLPADKPGAVFFGTCYDPNDYSYIGSNVAYYDYTNKSVKYIYTGSATADSNCATGRAE